MTGCHRETLVRLELQNTLKPTIPMDKERLKATICKMEFLLGTLREELFSEELQNVIEEEPTYTNVPVDDYDEVFYGDEM